MGSSNPRLWRGEQLQHHDDVVCHVVCAFCAVSDSWHVSPTCHAYILEVFEYLLQHAPFGHSRLHKTLPLLLHSSFVLEKSVMKAPSFCPPPAGHLCVSTKKLCIRAPHGARAYPWILNTYLSVRPCVRPCVPLQISVGCILCVKQHIYVVYFSGILLISWV